MSRWTFTSESVTEGHPDKMADQISDSVLDAILAEDPNGRVACETLLTTGLCVVAGEITTDGLRRHPQAGPRDDQARSATTTPSTGSTAATCGVIVSIDEQSPNIAQGVDASEELRGGTAGEDQLNAQGAGDQGMMFGFACDETPDLMPLPIWTAHRLAERLAEVRKSGQVPYLRPDGKTQVTYEYEDGRPVALKTVLISTQHQEGVDRDTVIRPDLIEQVIRPTIPEQFADDDYEVCVNPTGTFVLGGPHADCGLTGRKIIVDTYGGMGRHGGGAFSGKDPSKVDRSAAYAARWVAKHVVASGAATQLRGAGGLRHRHRPPDEHPRRDVRHQHRRPGRDREGRARGVRPAPGRDRPRPRPEAADLPGHRGLRPLRSAAARRSRGSTPAASTTSRRPSAPERTGAGAPASPGSLPDVTGLDKEFDYVVPAELVLDVRARVDGARAAARPAGRRLGRRARSRPTCRSTSTGCGRSPRSVRAGRTAELIELARWASVRWAAGRLRPFLVDAPARRRNVAGLPPRRAHGVAARSRCTPAPPTCWRAAAGCCGCRRPTTSLPVLARRGPARADAGRRAVAGPGPARRDPAAPGRAHRRRRARRSGRRPPAGVDVVIGARAGGVGAVPGSRRRRRRRRARRGAAGGAQPDVARPRRRRRAGPAGRRAGAAGVAVPDRGRPGRGRRAAGASRRSTTSGRAGRSSRSSTAAATSRGRRRS